MKYIVLAPACARRGLVRSGAIRECGQAGLMGWGGSRGTEARQLRDPRMSACCHIFLPLPLLTTLGPHLPLLLPGKLPPLWQWDEEANSDLPLPSTVVKRHTRGGSLCSRETTQLRLLSHLEGSSKGLSLTTTTRLSPHTYVAQCQHQCDLVRAYLCPLPYLPPHLALPRAAWSSLEISGPRAPLQFHESLRAELG